METKLQKIASVQMGYSFRSRLETELHGATAVIQMKNLTYEEKVDCPGLARADVENIKEHHRVRPGDLILRSRGNSATAAILAEDPGPAVVAAPLLRIRANPEAVLPEYLQWFINQAPAQAYLVSRASGTALMMISKVALESLPVFVPSLERQRSIAEVAELAVQEQTLITKLADLRRQYVSTELLQIAGTDDGNQRKAFKGERNEK